MTVFMTVQCSWQYSWQCSVHDSVKFVSSLHTAVTSQNELWSFLSTSSDISLPRPPPAYSWSCRGRSLALSPAEKSSGGKEDQKHPALVWLVFITEGIRWILSLDNTSKEYSHEWQDTSDPHHVPVDTQKCTILFYSFIRETLPKCSRPSPSPKSKPQIFKS